MKKWKILQACSILVGFLTILLPVLFWKQIPDQVPMHYNAAGVADAWSDKSTLFLLFFVVAFLMGIMAIVTYVVRANMLSEHSTEQEREQNGLVYPVIIVLNLVIQLMFSYIMFCVCTTRKLGAWFLPVSGLAVFVPLFVMVGKMKKTRKKYGEETRKPDATYRSKIDLWLGALLLVVPIIMIVSLVEHFRWSNLLILAGYSLIILPCFFIKYECYPEYLCVNCNIFGKERIYYDKITDMKKTRNPISSAALSLKRLQIDYVNEKGGHEMTLIAPKDRDAFMELINGYRK